MKRKRRTRLLRALISYFLKSDKFPTDLVKVIEGIAKSTDYRKKASLMTQLWNDLESLLDVVDDDMFEKSPEKRKFQL